MRVRGGDRTHHVVIVCSPNVNPGYRLVENARYPQIAADYERTFRVLKSLSADVFLGAHGSFFDLEGKYARLQRGERAAFVDPQGYQRYVAERERAFRAELARQKASSRPGR
jgi:metallo-beta-lactamase class B